MLSFTVQQYDNLIQFHLNINKMSCAMETTHIYTHMVLSLSLSLYLMCIKVSYMSLYLSHMEVKFVCWVQCRPYSIHQQLLREKFKQKFLFLYFCIMIFCTNIFYWKKEIWSSAHIIFFKNILFVPNLDRFEHKLPFLLKKELHFNQDESQFFFLQHDQFWDPSFVDSIWNIDFFVCFQIHF